MREVAQQRLDEARQDRSAVSTATTPGAARAAAQSIAADARVRMIAAPERDMQRARHLPVVDEAAEPGEQARVLGALDPRADDLRPRMDVVGLSHRRRHPCAGVCHCAVVVAADHGGAARSMRLTSASDFTSASAFQVLRGTMPVIERRAQADGVGGEQKRAVAVERDERADRAGRVAGQRDQHDAAVAEQVALAARSSSIGYRLIPLGREIALRLGVRRARRLDLARMDHECRALEEGVAAAMVGMQVRAHDDVDVVGRQGRCRRGP